MLNILSIHFFEKNKRCLFLSKILQPMLDKKLDVNQWFFDKNFDKN